jgi:hypothetical protein
MVMFDLECKKFENYLDHKMKFEKDAFLKIRYLNNDDKTLQMQVRTGQGYELEDCSLFYIVFYEVRYSENDIPIIFNSCPQSSVFKKVYNEKNVLNENQLIIEGDEIISDFISFMNLSDKSLRLKKLKEFIRKHELEEDFS